MKNINVQTIKTSERQFFLVWIELFQSFLKLGKQEKLVLSSFLYYRYKLSKQVSNPTIVDTLTFSTETRKQIKEDLDIDDAGFNNVLSALRKKKMIINNKINPKLIPQVEIDFKNFKLVYNININEDI